MGIFTCFTLRSLARNRVRTVVSIIGVALSCALLCAVLTSVVSMTNMLYERTAADEGTWQAEVASISQKGLDELTSDGRVADHIEVAELGAIDLGDENSSDYGHWLFTKTWPAQPHGTNLVSAPEIISGRAPEAPGEIVLPHYLEDVSLAPCGLETAGVLGLGSAVTLDLGTRTVTMVDPSDGSTDRFVGTSNYGSYFAEDGTTSEEFAQDLGSISGTVVGFYRSYGFSSTMALQGNSAYVYDDGSAVASALSDSSDATTAFSIFSARDPRDIPTMTSEITDDDSYCTGGVATHNSLLRWQGVTGNADIWNTLYGIAGILAVVIIIAGVSLVYNSFAISVSERTRQFGLLSSLGASKRQLRRTVLVEALLLGVIGIPLGLVLGLAGCAVVFRMTGEGLASMFDIETYGLAVRVVVDPMTLAVSAALALATLLISAWIPALRASRVSAVDAIRQSQDVHLSRRARRALARTSRRANKDGNSDVRMHGLAARLFGVPGFVAHRNLSRSTSKGRVTVAALAVSVALLIIAGSIGDALGYASGTALNTIENVDLGVYIDATTSENGDGPLLRKDGEVNHQAFQDSLNALYQRTQDLDGATALGYSTSYIADAIIPASMISDGGKDFFDILLTDGSWSGPIYVEFIDDATWQAYIDSLGLPEDDYCDPAHPLAVALDTYDVSNSSTYSSYQPFAGPGTVQTVTFADINGYYAAGVFSNNQGEPTVWYNSPDGDEQCVPLSEGIATSTDLAVGALANTAPAGITGHTNTPILMLPASAIAACDGMGFGSAEMRYDTGGSAETASKVQDAFEQIATDFPGLDCTYNNFAQSKQQSRMMSQTIQTFIYCFTVITGMIAVANVFNTLSNSVMLRRREFAVLKSIGMGNRAFHRMIAYECTSYALRGFAIGLALAAVVAAFLYQSMQLSFTTYQLGLPWTHVALSAAIVLAVIVVSVAYALRRSRAASVVEALREDAI
ncbi:ABC transporter permease [Collinsella sp. An2]|uniref:ABC transporter permease n=1 Tax=Collinsella sp. An2 TaxID=1965585 RepID=UPI000B37C6C5|nr:ABC transporter permease [Collinsella sp. An2]OUP10089.1 hypothetical protein B5F33_03285 [Collinsella sp. An2]